MSKKKSKKALVKKLAKNLKQLNEKEQLEGLIKDNKVELEIKGIKYRIHKPNQAESLETRKARTKKYIELLKNDDYMLKEQLIELYKKKDIDIEKIELDIKELEYKIEDVQQVLDKTENKKTVEDLKQKINDLITKQSKLALRVTELLEPCLENEIIEFGNFYLVYILLEKQGKVGEKSWIKVFNTYEDFLNSEDEQLILEAIYNHSLLIFKEKLGNEDE